MIERGIEAAVAYRLGSHEKGLNYKTTTRQGYREYILKEDHCVFCDKREACLTGKNSIRTLRRHVREDYKEEVLRFTRQIKESQYIKEEKRQ